MLAANRSYRVRISYLVAEPDQISAAGKVRRTRVVSAATPLALYALWRAVPASYRPGLPARRCAWRAATCADWGVST